MARFGGHRQGGTDTRNARENHRRNRLLPAQHGLVAGAIQRGRPPALGRGESAALAAGCSHERGSRSNQDGKRSAQSRRAQAHGSECDAEGRIETLNAREVQTRRLGRRLPDQTLGDVLKCDCPGRWRRAPPASVQVSYRAVVRNGMKRLRRDPALDTVLYLALFLAGRFH